MNSPGRKSWNINEGGVRRWDDDRGSFISTSPRSQNKIPPVSPSWNTRSSPRRNVEASRSPPSDQLANLKNQWNVNRDIPAGTVRNNPFLPKKMPGTPPSPQLIHQKKQWDTRDIPRGSVASRAFMMEGGDEQQIDQNNKFSGQTRLISSPRQMNSPNRRSFASSSSYLETEVRVQPPPSPRQGGIPPSPRQGRTNSSPRQSYTTMTHNLETEPTEQISSRQNVKVSPVLKVGSRPQMGRSFPKKQQEGNMIPSSGTATTTTSRFSGWEPSREIPKGTVKGRVSSLFGQSSGSGDIKLTQVSKKPTTPIEGSDDDPWIIPTKTTAVFPEDWGGDVGTKSSDSEEWDNPTKDWLRVSESQTTVSDHGNEAAAVYDAPPLLVGSEEKQFDQDEQSLSQERDADVLEMAATKRTQEEIFDSGFQAADARDMDILQAAKQKAAPERRKAPPVLAPPPKDAFSHRENRTNLRRPTVPAKQIHENTLPVNEDGFPLADDLFKATFDQPDPFKESTQPAFSLPVDEKSSLKEYVNVAPMDIHESDEEFEDLDSPILQNLSDVEGSKKQRKGLFKFFGGKKEKSSSKGKKGKNRFARRSNSKPKDPNVPESSLKPNISSSDYQTRSDEEEWGMEQSPATESIEIMGSPRVQDAVIEEQEKVASPKKTIIEYTRPPKTTEEKPKEDSNETRQNENTTQNEDIKPSSYFDDSWTKSEKTAVFPELDKDTLILQSSKGIEDEVQTQKADFSYEDPNVKSNEREDYESKKFKAVSPKVSTVKPTSPMKDTKQFWQEKIGAPPPPPPPRQHLYKKQSPKRSHVQVEPDPDLDHIDMEDSDSEQNGANEKRGSRQVTNLPKEDSSKNSRLPPKPNNVRKSETVAKSSSEVISKQQRVENITKLTLVPQDAIQQSSSTGSDELSKKSSSSMESDIRVLRSVLRRPRRSPVPDAIIRPTTQFKAYDVDTADPLQRAGLKLLSAAITPIQTEVRRFLALRRALTRMWALIVIQAHTRQWLARKRYVKSIQSAVKIQAVMRGNLARDDMDYKHVCAIEIQRFMRGYLATMSVYEDIYKVTIVQNAWRKQLAIRKLKSLRQEKIDRAAAVIQAKWRQYDCTMNFLHYLADILVAQSAIRRFLAKKRVSRIIEDEKHAAARKIQSVWRGFASYADYMFAIADIVTVQKLARGWLAKRAANQIRSNAAFIIQKNWRRYVAKIHEITRVSRELAEMENRAATTIQTFLRCVTLRNAYRYYRSAVIIQSSFRGMKARQDSVILRGEVLAATLIQSAWRGFVSYTDYIFTISDIIMAQKVARGYMSRKKNQKAIAKMTEKVRVQRETRNAARLIQTGCRGFLARQKYWYTLGCTMQVQSWIRGRLVILKQQREQSASLKIQCATRCWLARQKYLQKKFIMALIHAAELERTKNVAALVIQDMVRNYLERKRRDKAARIIQGFFLMVKHEVDQLVRSAKRRKKWRKKQIRKQKQNLRLDGKDEDFLLEDAWENSVCDSNLENDDSFSYYNISNLTSNSKEWVGNENDRDGGGQRMDSQKTSSNNSKKMMKKNRLPPAYSSASKSSTRKVLHPHQQHEDDQSEYSQLSGSTCQHYRLPPARMKKMSSREMDEDLELEVAYMDAEISSARDRRMAEKQTVPSTKVKNRSVVI